MESRGPSSGRSAFLRAYYSFVRLTNETVIVGLVTNRTVYSWDNAGNRNSKAVYSNAVLLSTATYSNNALNQMVSSSENRQSEIINHQYTYDLNGAGNGASELSETAVKQPHANKVDDRPATLYEKYDADGNFEKHGITKHEDPSKRYTKKENGGGRCVQLRGDREGRCLKKSVLV